MPSSETFVIIGGGLAGAKAAEALRAADFAGTVILFSDEDHLPYERPPLSKEYFAGKQSLAGFTVQPSAWYRDEHVDLRLGTKVESIDTSAHEVRLPDGATQSYDKLLLATGSRSRLLPVDGADASGVFTLRTVDDSDALSSALTPESRLAIVGAGWIGLEIAANARERGVNVTVVEAAELPLLGSLGPEMGTVFAELHREHGVDLRLGARLEAITVDAGKATGLSLADGTTIEADAVLVAVGAQANIELAEQAGLTVEGGGVAVDGSLRASDPDVFAVGDIATVDHPVLGERIRTEHWQTALDTPPVAAKAMLGKKAEYTDLPYFFTDQYDLGMEYVGHARDYEQVVVRGDARTKEFIAFWLDEDNHVLAGMNVNVWDVVDDVKALITSGITIDPERLADEDVPLGDLLG